MAVRAKWKMCDGRIMVPGGDKLHVAVCFLQALPHMARRPVSPGLHSREGGPPAHCLGHQWSGAGSQ